MLITSTKAELMSRLRGTFGDGRRPNSDRARKSFEKMANVFPKPARATLIRETVEHFDYLESLGLSGFLFPIFSSEYFSTSSLLESTEQARPDSVEHAHVDPYWSRILSQHQPSDVFTVGAGLALYAKSPVGGRYTHNIGSGLLHNLQRDFSISFRNMTLEKMGVRDFLSIVWAHRAQGVQPKSRRFPFNKGSMLISESRPSAKLGVAMCRDGRIFLQSRANSTTLAKEGVGIVIRTGW